MVMDEIRNVLLSLATIEQVAVETQLIYVRHNEGMDWLLQQLRDEMMATLIMMMAETQTVKQKMATNALITTISLSIVTEVKYEEMERIMVVTCEMMATTTMEMAEAQVALLRMAMNDLKALQHIVTYEQKHVVMALIMEHQNEKMETMMIMMGVVQHVSLNIAINVVEEA